MDGVLVFMGREWNGYVRYHDSETVLHALSAGMAMSEEAPNHLSIDLVSCCKSSRAALSSASL